MAEGIKKKGGGSGARALYPLRTSRVYLHSVSSRRLQTHLEDEEGARASCRVSYLRMRGLEGRIAEYRYA